jgi:FkbM family methyltransferase
VTDCRFVAALKAAEGQVEGIPRPANFHSKYGEWLGSLRSVAAELGAGWGPWLAACGVAAQRRGIVDIALIAVEGDAGHFGFLQQHLRTNGFDPARQELHQGIIAAKKQVALFPIVASAASSYGQAPLSFADDGVLTAFFDNNRHLRRADYTQVPVFTPTELFAGHERVDLVHIDIQGGEADLVDGAMADFSRCVRRIVVGTHGRAIEERLHIAFGGTDWRLEHDDPCRLAIVAGRPLLAHDGTQVWVNTRLAAP